MGLYRIKQLLDNDKGIALVVVLLLFTVLTLLVASIIGLTATNMKMSSHERENQSSYYIAEAGATYIQNIISSNIVEVYEKSADPRSFFINMEQNFNRVSPLTYNNFDKIFGDIPKAEIEIKKVRSIDELTREYEIISKGIIGTQSRTVSKSFQIHWKKKNEGSIPINMALFTNGTIELSGGATIDGSVGTNSLTANAISLSGGAKINGDIFIPKGAGNEVLDIPDWLDFKGKVIKMESVEDLQMPDFPIIPTNYSIPEDVQIVEGKGNKNKHEVIYNGNVQITNWMADDYTLRLNSNLSLNEIEINSNYTLNIELGDKDREIVVNKLNVQNGHINLIGTGRLTIYVVDSIEMGSGSTINKKGEMEQLIVYLKGSGDPKHPKNIKLSGSQEIYGSLYAEDANIEIAGGGGFQGHIFTGGNDFKISGGAWATSNLIFAPNADFTLSGGGSVVGAIITKTFKGSGGTTVTHNIADPDNIPFLPSSGLGESEKTINDILTTGGLIEVSDK